MVSMATRLQEKAVFNSHATRVVSSAARVHSSTATMVQCSSVARIELQRRASYRGWRSGEAQDGLAVTRTRGSSSFVISSMQLSLLAIGPLAFAVALELGGVPVEISVPSSVDI